MMLFEVSIGCVLLALGALALALPRITYTVIDATAGRTAEKWAQAGADASWRMYHWQRPLLRFLIPVIMLIVGIGFLASGLRIRP